MSTVSGACVSRARFAAALGSPIPTNRVAPLRIIRAAAIVIISSVVYAASGILRRLLQALLETAEILRPHNVPLDPFLKTLALPRDGVPLLVERVVTPVIPLCIGRKRPALHLAHRAHHPRRQHR